jgi:Ribbon-helix-helix protein, copG family
MFSERTHVRLSRAQIAKLKRIAQREDRSVGAVIREAIDAFGEPAAERRMRAARELTSMNAPVDDWQVMKEQIARSQLGD